MCLDGPSNKHKRTLGTGEEALLTGNEIRQWHHSLGNGSPQYSETPTSIKHIQFFFQECNVNSFTKNNYRFSRKTSFTNCF